MGKLSRVDIKKILRDKLLRAQLIKLAVESIVNLRKAGWF